MPDGTDVTALVLAAYRRGVLLEDAAPHWADPSAASPALVPGYATLDETAVGPAVAKLADALDESRRRVGSQGA